MVSSIAMNDLSQKNRITCPECQVGKFELKKITYYTYLGEELITVPDFPCWVCNVCKRHEYDQKALNQVYMVLNANLGKPVSQKHKRKASKPANSRPGRTQQSE